jgi:hypothetical protein
MSDEQKKPFKNAQPVMESDDAEFHGAFSNDVETLEEMAAFLRRNFARLYETFRSALTAYVDHISPGVAHQPLTFTAADDEGRTILDVLESLRTFRVEQTEDEGQIYHIRPPERIGKPERQTICRRLFK